MPVSHAPITTPLSSDCTRTSIVPPWSVHLQALFGRLAHRNSLLPRAGSGPRGSTREQRQPSGVPGSCG
jgi:hypothetical protein